MVQRADLPVVMQAATPNVVLNPWTAAHAQPLAALWRMMIGGLTARLPSRPQWFTSRILGISRSRNSWQRATGWVASRTVAGHPHLCRGQTRTASAIHLGTGPGQDQSVVVVQSPTMRITASAAWSYGSQEMPWHSEIALDLALDVFQELTGTRRPSTPRRGHG